MRTQLQQKFINSEMVFGGQFAGQQFQAPPWGHVLPSDRARGVSALYQFAAMETAIAIDQKGPILRHFAAQRNLRALCRWTAVRPGGRTPT